MKSIPHNEQYSKAKREELGNILLTLAVFGCVFVTVGADLRTNQLMIGGTVVDSRVVDGKIVGDKWIVVSNSLVRIHIEVNPLEAPVVVPEVIPSSQDDSTPSLQLMLATGDGPTRSGGVKGLHGLICMANDWRTPGLAQTNRVDIISTDDKTRIVVMVRDNGPIYNSINSGMTWTVINAPGKYQFPLTSGPDGGGFFAEATLEPSPENQSSTNTPASNWYVVGSASDGSKLVMTKDSSQPAPVLSITPSNGGMGVSWSAAFSGLVLQANSDLNTTNWVNVTNSVKVAGEENQVIISSPTGINFYRLRNQ